MENRKYRILSDIQHILLRPGMYIGSVITERSNQYVLDDRGKFVLKEVRYNSGFLKLFDEILSNSVDESKRKNTRLTTIKVDVDKIEGTISVYDNGGIPVKIMEGTKDYIPVVCFSRLRAGSNFDDTEKRTWVGTNGVGSVATNIFSTLFELETADGKNKLSMYWSDNMKSHALPKVTKTIQHYTRVTFTPDLQRFGMDCIDDDAFKLIEKRVYEVAGCNPNLNVFFNGKKIQINSFKDYCNMYLNDGDLLLYDENKDWQIGVSVSPSGSFQQVSYVNCVSTTDGGTHVDYIINQITPTLREKINKKYKTDIMPGQIKNHIFLFVNSTVFNPSFSSQTKEKLITDIKNFGTEFKLTEKFINQIYKSEITNSITDWLDQKKIADEKKAEREANKSITKVKVEKLVDCKFAGSPLKKHLTSLSITEGDSAAAGFRKFRNPETQGLYPIRGKILNIRDIPKEKIRANVEIQGIMAAMGLKFGQSPFEYRNGKVYQDNLRIHEIRILSDADQDGSSIAGLVLNIFAYFWPELIKEHRIARVDTPIVIVRQGKKKVKFYYQNEYDEWCKNNDVSKWEVEYLKGLSALRDDDYKDIIQNPNMYYYELDDLAHEELDIWFGKDSNKRKEKLLK